jgi:hypothetical protein
MNVGYGHLGARSGRTRWTRRPGYPIRCMIGMALAKSIYAVPTWTRTVALVREHVALRTAIVGGNPDVPVRVGGHIARVDGDVPPILGKLLTRLAVTRPMQRSSRSLWVRSLAVKR